MEGDSYCKNAIIIMVL